MHLDYIEEPALSYSREMKYLAMAIGRTTDLLGPAQPDSVPLPPKPRAPRAWPPWLRGRREPDRPARDGWIDLT